MITVYVIHTLQRLMFLYCSVVLSLRLQQEFCISGYKAQPDDW